MTEPIADTERTHDIVIVGGGLSGALIALRLKQKRPDLDVLLLEGGETLGGHHTWSFHETDLAPQTLAWLQPLIAHRWESQEVHFPNYERRITTPYCSVSSERLHDAVAPVLGDSVRVRCHVHSVDAEGVVVGNGTRINGKAVIDARGQGDYSHLALGFQKFVGQVFEFDKPHGLTAPIIMDSKVDQLDGYRFVYVLPFTDKTALVEDTYYADGKALNVADVNERLEQYCLQRGWNIRNTLYTEHGVLPVALGGDIHAHLDETVPGTGVVGLRAGLFHPLTGYSLPDAASLADAIADLDDVSGPSLASFTRERSIETWNGRKFYRFLSRLLFDAAEPSQRYIVMQRFYRFNRPLVERFYSGKSEPQDKLRILAGKPPVSVFKALRCIDERRWTEKHTSSAA